MSVDRRSIVTAAVALPAMAVPAMAIAVADPDPVYAAIAKHKRAYDSLDALITAGGEGDRREIDARHELLETVPITKDGLAAFLSYILSYHEPEVLTDFLTEENAPTVVRTCIASLAMQSQSVQRPQGGPLGIPPTALLPTPTPKMSVPARAEEPSPCRSWPVPALFAMNAR